MKNRKKKNLVKVTYTEEIAGELVEIPTKVTENMIKKMLLEIAN